MDADLARDLISTLRRVSGGIRIDSRNIRDGLAPQFRGSKSEDDLLRMAADLEAYSVEVDSVIESLRDWNSRHNLPIP